MGTGVRGMGSLRFWPPTLWQKDVSEVLRVTWKNDIIAYIFTYILQDFPTSCFNPNLGQLLLLSHWVISDSLQSHRLQHKRLLCSSQSPRMCSNSKWTFELMMSFNHLIFCHPFLLLPLSMPNSRKKYCMVGQRKSWNFTFPGPKKGRWIELVGFPFGPCSKG